MRRTFRTTLLVLASLPTVMTAIGTPASAEPRRCGEPGRPVCTILRPPALGPPPETDFTAPECIVVVGGFGSTNGDRAFDDVFGWTEDSSFYQVFHFGSDFAADRVRPPRYDSTGPIDVSAKSLWAFVRSLSPHCRGIDLIAHSMGGVVADRAIKKGLSSNDRLKTYVALSSPHNGATLAHALHGPIVSDPLVAIELSVLARSLGQPDPTTPAGHDLAWIETPHRTIPADIASARFRMATDAMVLRRDNMDRRVDVREYFALDAIEGHGAILHNDEVRAVVHTTVASHAVAVDHRSAIERQVADLVSRKLDESLTGLYRAISSYLVGPAAPFVLAETYGIVALAKRVWEAVTRSLAEIPEGRIWFTPSPGLLMLP